MGPVLQVTDSTVVAPSFLNGAASPAGSPGPSNLPNTQDLAVVDRWLALEAKLAPLGPEFKERDELRAKMLGWFPNLPADQGTTVNGTEANIWITPRDNDRKITEVGKRALQKLWGLRLFRANARFSLYQLPDPKDPQNLYTFQERTGPRRIKVLPRMNPAA